MKLLKQELSVEEIDKANADLQIIDRITKTAQDSGMKVIISGGYAVDGFLGEISRPHNDIDIQIYGVNENAETVVNKLLDSISSVEFDHTTEDKGRKEYYHNLVCRFENSILDIYYLRTKTSPLGKEKYIIKDNGEVDKQEFKTPMFGKINDIAFEIQSPEAELKDKIYKRDVRGDSKRPEHEQDIENLKQNI